MTVFDFSLSFILLETELSRLAVFKPFTAVFRLVSYFDFIIYLLLIYQITKKKYSEKYLFYSIFALGIFFLSYFFSGKTVFFMGGLFILAAKDISFRHIIRIYKNILIISLSIALFTFLLGVSGEPIDISAGLSLGYGNANQAGQILMLLVLLCSIEKNRLNSLKNKLIVEFIGLLVLLITNSRGSAACIMLFPLLISVFDKISPTKKKTFLCLSTACVPSILCYLVFYTAQWYKSATILVLAVDFLLSGRIFQNSYALEKNGLTLLGQNINLRFEEGVMDTISNQWFSYLTIDNTYMMSLLVLGLIPTIVVLLAYFMFIVKIWNRHNAVILSASTVLCLYALIESQMIGIDRFFVFFCLSASVMHGYLRTLKNNYI